MMPYITLNNVVSLIKKRYYKIRRSWRKSIF